MHTEREHDLTDALPWVLCGVAAEVGAGFELLCLRPWSALVLHVLAALAFGLLAAAGQPRLRRASLIVAFLLVLTLPVLGALGVWCIVIPGWRGRQPTEVDDVIEVGMPELGAGAPELASGPIEVVLRSGGSAHERVVSVMALRRMDAHLAVPLLRVALADANEDVRLLAYAILERREKDLRRRIDTTRAALDALPAGDVSARASALRALVEHHWELVNGGFVSGELDTSMLQAAVRYGHESLLLVPDGSLALLLARIRLRCGDGKGALRYLRAANALGVATAVLAPLYAEVAFLLRRFDAIAPLLAEAGDVARPRLDAVVRFWNEGSDA